MLRSPAANSLIKMVIQRQFSMTAALQQAKVDPIKQAFAEKVREYYQKQTAIGDQKLVDADASVNKAFQEDLDRVRRAYQVKGEEEFIKFPSLQFEEPKIDPVDLHETKQEDNLRW